MIALCALAKEVVWINRMMIELGITNKQAPIIMCDNQSTIRIAKSERATTRTRHLRAQNDYVRELIELKELSLEHVSSDKQQADLLTKIVQTGKFITNRDMLLTQDDESAPPS